MTFSPMRQMENAAINVLKVGRHLDKMRHWVDEFLAF